MNNMKMNLVINIAKIIIIILFLIIGMAYLTIISLERKILNYFRFRKNPKIRF